MRSFFKFLFWCVILCVISYGIYYCYTHWWRSGTVRGDVEGVSVRAIEDKSREFVGTMVDAAKKSVSSQMRNTAASALSSISEKLHSLATSIVGESFSEAPTSSSLNNVSQNKTTSSSEYAPVTVSKNSLPISSGDFSLESVSDSAFLVPPPFAAIMAKVKIPLSFSINRAGVSYNITWGDGNIATGTVPSNTFKVVEHAWSTKGDYIMKVVIREGDAQLYSSSFPVRVYE